MAASGNKRKPRGKSFEKGNTVGNRFKPGQSGNPDGRPKCSKSPSEVLAELVKLGFSNMKDYMAFGKDGDLHLNWAEMTRNQAAAIQEVTIDEYTDGAGEDAREVKKTKFKLADKRGALEMLGRHYKLFTDKMEHTGKDGGPIVFDSVTDSDLADRAATLTKMVLNGSKSA